MPAVNEYIKFRYKGKIVEGLVIRVIKDPLHPDSYAVAIGGRTVRVLTSEVVK
jgi:hypothetical protein